MARFVKQINPRAVFLFGCQTPDEKAIVYVLCEHYLNATIGPGWSK